MKHIFNNELNEKYVNLGILDTEPFELNNVLRNLISFIEISSYKDNEIATIYNDVFINYLTYCRNGLHKEILENIKKNMTNNDLIV